MQILRSLLSENLTQQAYDQAQESEYLTGTAGHSEKYYQRHFNKHQATVSDELMVPTALSNQKAVSHDLT